MMLRARGMSLIEVVIGTTLMLVVFLSLFGALRASIVLSTLAKSKAAASEIAQSQVEYLRSLSYDAIGTVGGIPAGVVPEYATTTEDNLTYVTHSFISYIDDPADGTGAGDTNGITTDYKRARVTVIYSTQNGPKSVAVISNFAPLGLETTTGGGTLEVAVVSAQGTPLPGATVNIQNAALSPSVDLTTLSDSQGIVYLPGAATSTAYQVSTTESGYSTAQTYARDATNVNPTPGYLTVVKNQTTTGTFAIDQLAHLTITTFSPIATSTFTDTFVDATKLAAMSSTTVAGGVLALTAGETSGSARSIATTSARLVRWGTIAATDTVPTGMSLVFHVYAGGVLVPDTALPGNAAGFASLPVDLAAISTTTYPSLAVGANFASDGSGSPTIDSWSLSYLEGPFPLPNVSLTLTGAKTIGSRSDSSPIYKTVVTSSSGTGASVTLPLEWDSYSLSVSGYSFYDACPMPPYALSPGTSTAGSLTLIAPSSNSLLVSVTDTAGSPVAGALVEITKTGVDRLTTASSCGNAYFGSLSSGSYTVTISKGGYATTAFPNVPVAGVGTFTTAFP